MKKGKIQVVLLALVILMPLVVTTIVKMSNSNDVCELAEIPTEEEQRSEQEPEEKEGEKEMDEYLFHNLFGLMISESHNIKHLQKAKKITSINREILTPPPELV